jgi:hypothetical protein
MVKNCEKVVCVNLPRHPPEIRMGGVPQFWGVATPNRVNSSQRPFRGHSGWRRGNHVGASGELGDEWVLIGNSWKMQDAPDWIRRIRRRNDPEAKHPRLKCPKCTGDASMSKQMNRGSTENERLATVSYARMATSCVQIRRVRLFSKNFKRDNPISGPG